MLGIIGHGAEDGNGHLEIFLATNASEKPLVNPAQIRVYQRF
jgi:hypothetical protein